MNNKQYILWLDDERNPFDEKDYYNVDDHISWNYLIKYFSKAPDMEIVWCKNYDEFCHTVEENGMPYYVFFDNDLGEMKEGYDCAKWLVDYCIDNHREFPNYYIQSMNMVARKNIESLVSNYKKYFEKD